jgi:hypothetical protein
MNVCWQVVLDNIRSMQRMVRLFFQSQIRPSVHQLWSIIWFGNAIIESGDQSFSIFN